MKFRTVAALVEVNVPPGYSSRPWDSAGERLVLYTGSSRPAGILTEAMSRYIGILAVEPGIDPVAGSGVRGHVTVPELCNV